MLLRTLLLSTTLLVSAAASASAADLIIPTTPQPIMASAGFDWDGLYIGARAGGFSANNNLAGAASFGLIGAVAGVNFTVADPIFLGVDLNADYYWNNGNNGYTFWANLRAGAVLVDNVAIYALAGVGYDVTNGVVNDMPYQIGGGLEFAVTDSIVVRADIAGTGDFTGGAGDRFFEGAQATVGLSYYF